MRDVDLGSGSALLDWLKNNVMILPRVSAYS